MNKKKGEYEQEEDILFIHNKICKYFNNEKLFVDEYNNLILSLCSKCLNSEIPYGVDENDINYLKSLSKIDDLEGSKVLLKKTTSKKINYKDFNDIVSFIYFLNNYIKSIVYHENIYYCVSANIIENYKKNLEEGTTTSFLGNVNKQENIKVKNIILEYKECIKKL